MSSFVRRRRRRWCALAPVALDQLVEALRDDEWAIREQAANALGRFRDSRAVDPLMAALKDKDGRSGRRQCGRWNGSVTRVRRPACRGAW